jgi:hypothetical protein
MNHKLTPLELEKWSKFYLDYFNGFMTSPAYTNSSVSEQEKAKKLASLIYSQIKLGNTLTILFFADNLINTLKLLPADADIHNLRHPDIDNLTYEEYLTNIKKRVKEHHIARGYYNPNNPLSLATFNQKVKNIKPSQNKGDKLLAQMNEEDLSLTWNFFNFVKLLKEIDPTLDFSAEKDMSEEEYKEFGFLFEDLIKTIEAAEKKLEQKGNATSSQELTNDEKQGIAKKLAADKSKLETQKEKLENRADLDQSLRDQLLAENAREIAKLDEELAKLRKSKPSQPTNTEKDNSKLNWAIGLGIVAVVIGLICLILVASRRKER